MNYDFRNQVILITGSSQGIGKALAIHLGSRGAKIGLNGRNLKKLEKAHSELTELGINNHMVPGDVTDYNTCEDIIGQMIKKYGKLNCLVTNASMMVEGTIQEIQAEVFKKAIESQILGAVYPIKTALPALIKNNGYILLISSLSALYGLPRFSSYSMGKTAQTNLAQSLRFELLSTGVDIGVAYVCFTENEPQKQMVLPDGNLCGMPKRPGKLQYPREKVAISLSKMIKKRKHKKIISFYGKTYGFASRFAPSILRNFIKKSLPI